jgi:hypothetical protein
MKQLGTGLSLIFFTLGISSTAQAYPPQCFDVCSCESSCGQKCYYGTFLTTCADEICVDYDYCWSGATHSSLTQDAQKQQDASQEVCTEQVQQSISSES